MEKISIIISTFKGEDSIVRCVESAMGQDYQNFEVIVVDDNGLNTESQKNTERLLYPYMESAAFKYIAHEKNKNGSAARNTGIIHSSGEYIAFLDDDDILHSNSIRLRYNKLSCMPNDYGIVFASFSQYSSSGALDFECHYNFEGNILLDYLRQKIHSPSSVIMIKKEVIDEIGYWDESFRRHQDWEFVTRALAKFKACSINEITVDRILTWRNNAKDPVVFEKNRLHYLNKMADIISSLDETAQKEIKFIHYTDIGKNYLKHLRFLKSIKWAKKSPYLKKTLALYFQDSKSYFGKILKRKKNERC